MLNTQAATSVASTVNASLLTLLRMTAAVFASTSVVRGVAATPDPVEATVTCQGGGAPSLITRATLAFMAIDTIER